MVGLRRHVRVSTHGLSLVYSRKILRIHGILSDCTTITVNTPGFASMCIADLMAEELRPTAPTPH